MKLDCLIAVARALQDASVRYLVVDGVAVNAHGYQRLTNDLDLVLDMRTGNVRAALTALAELGYRPMLPVGMDDFADPELRTQWIVERNLQVFSLISDRFAEATVDLFATEPRERLAVLEELARTSEALVAPGRGGLRPGASKQEEC